VTLRVVIADDTADIRRLLRELLALEEDLTVVGEAADGLEAIEAARANHPDAVLLDLAMPRMDGLEALPQILAASPRTKIVVLSGFEVAAMADKAMECGAHAYLPKGTSGAAIAEKIRQVCGAAAGVGPEAGGDEREKPNRVTATAVHELRNQVTVVEGFTTALRDSWESLSEERRRDFFDRVLRNVSQMRAILGALGDLTKIERHDLVLDLRRVAVDQLVRHTVEDLAVSASRDIALRVEQEVHVLADAVRLRQVVTNLLVNAVKFSPQDRPIQVGVGAVDGAAEITVVDGGPGVPPERARELFQPFSRLGSEQPGTGLGLYISREIMLAHGGSLELVDRPEGACFAVRIPALP
jgi:signal transduction histidine kinase